MDCDGQDPIEVTLLMLEKMTFTGCDVVNGKRNKRDDGFLKKTSANFFYRIINTNVNGSDFFDVADFRLMNRHFISEFAKYTEPQPYLRGIAANMGFHQEFIYFNRPKRFAGKTKYTLKKMLNLSISGIFGFTAAPLKFIFFLSGFSLVVTFAIFLYIIGSYVISKSVQLGWTSLMIVVSFFSSITIFSLGIIGIYLEKIFNQTKNRPNYHIKYKINLK